MNWSIVDFKSFMDLEINDDILQAIRIMEKIIDWY